MIPDSVTSIGAEEFVNWNIDTLTLKTSSKALGLESENIGRATDKVMGITRETGVYEIESHAFSRELLIGSSKIARDMALKLGITMSRSKKKRVRTYMLCLLHKLPVWKSKGYILDAKIWGSPVLARCLEATIKTSRKYSVNKINSTITKIGNECRLFALSV